MIIKINVNDDLYTEYKQLVKIKTNEFIMGYNIELFETVIRKDIERLKQLPNKNNRSK